MGSPPPAPVRMWNDTGQSGIGERGPHRVEAGLGVVALGRNAGNHRAAQPCGGRPLDLVDRGVGIDGRDHRQTDEPALARGAEVDEPVVVRADARDLVVAVLRLRERHPDRGIQHLGGDAVGVHVLEPHLRVPTAGSQRLGGVAARPQVVRRLARRAGEPDRERLQSVDDEQVAVGVVLDHVRRPIGERSARHP